MSWHLSKIFGAQPGSVHRSLAPRRRGSKHGSEPVGMTPAPLPPVYHCAARSYLEVALPFFSSLFSPPPSYLSLSG